MSLEIGFKVEGGAELDRMFSELPKSVAKSTLTRVLKDLATPVAGDAAQRAPRGFGPGPHLADSWAVGTKVKASQKRYVGGIKGGVTVFAGSKDRKAILIEFGTGPRYQKNGKFAGQVTPHPMLRPAWDSRKATIEKELSSRLWHEIEKSARRLARSAQKILSKVKKD